MRSLSLLFFILSLLWLTACVSEPITPFSVAEYPATWTPGPTATNTPRPPTATLVIQHTPGAVATRNPNTRRVPIAPRGGIGVWLDVSQLKPESLPLLAPRAQIFVQDANASNPRSANNFYFLKLNQASGNVSELAARYDGVLVQDTAQFNLAALRAQIAPRLVIVETPLSNASDATDLLTQVDGICFCNFLREANTPRDTFKTETAWKRDVDTLAALSSNPNTFLFTATRFPDDAAKNFQEMQFWLDYAAASFLLGVNNSHTFFGFQGKAAQEFLGAPTIAAQIGSPNGALFKANGLYQRRFTRGLVLVNPTLETRAFALARNYLTVNGNKITQVEMPPQSGMILLNVE